MGFSKTSVKQQTNKLCTTYDFSFFLMFFLGISFII